MPCRPPALNAIRFGKLSDYLFDDGNPQQANIPMRRALNPVIRTIFLACYLALPLASCDRRQSTGSNDSIVYDRVIKTKILRVAYISYPPSFIKDANSGQYGGIFHEVLSEMARRMDIKTEYVEETAWGTMIEAVNSGRVDLVCTGLWPNAGRGKLVDFTDPVYFSPIKAYVKSGNRAFDGNLMAIHSKNVRIAAIDGEMTSVIAATDYPDATVDQLPQTTDVAQVLLEVATSKADITFVEPAVAFGFLKANPGLVQEVINVPPLRVFPNVMMIAKGESKLMTTLNTAMAELANTGIIDRIIDKYEKPPGAFFLRRQWPYRSTP
jgi:ABC-type amino acid transport substrate-binding protein